MSVVTPAHCKQSERLSRRTAAAIRSKSVIAKVPDRRSTRFWQRFGRRARFSLSIRFHGVPADERTDLTRTTSCRGLCFERIAPEHLLRIGYALGASLAKERNSPVEKDGKPILEASQRGEVDDKPKQPSRKTGNAQRTDRSDCT